MPSPRRSARQARLPVLPAVQEPAKASKPPIAKVAAKRQSVSATAGNPIPTLGSRKRNTKNIPAPAQDQIGSKNRLCSLPPEILTLALDNVNDARSMGALGRTCKALYSMMMPRLYRRIAVAAMFHAHIPKLIRTLEPHLTIEQKKQLKREGKYRGQQERYPSGLDEQATPFCASYVRQLVVGVADPGKKHKYIVDRYVEEVLKNLHNLETVETRMLTR
jgi:hypothetical protein